MKRSINILSLYIILCLMVLSVAAVCSAAGESSGGKPPIDITSDSLEATGGDIVFFGNVRAVYGDMTINADKVKIIYESPSGKDQAVKEITATGNVALVQSGRQAWSDKLVYVRTPSVATLTGSPRIKEENNTIAGDLIKIFIDEDRVEIKGNVRALVKPETVKEK